MVWREIQGVVVEKKREEEGQLPRLIAGRDRRWGGKPGEADLWGGLEVGDGIYCPEGSVQLQPHALSYVHTQNFCQKCGQSFCESIAYKS